MLDPTVFSVVVSGVATISAGASIEDDEEDEEAEEEDEDEEDDEEDEEEDDEEDDKEGKGLRSVGLPRENVRGSRPSIRPYRMAMGITVSVT